MSYCAVCCFLTSLKERYQWVYLLGHTCCLHSGCKEKKRKKLYHRAVHQREEWRGNLPISSRWLKCSLFNFPAFLSCTEWSLLLRKLGPPPHPPTPMAWCSFTSRSTGRRQTLGIRTAPDPCRSPSPPSQLRPREKGGPEMHQIKWPDNVVKGHHSLLLIFNIAVVDSEPISATGKIWRLWESLQKGIWDTCLWWPQGFSQWDSSAA